MIERVTRIIPNGATADKGNHFLAAPTSKLTFIHSGCTLLDCVLGGGWALGRVANIVGDKSTGKTLLAIEAAANFKRQFSKGKNYYREAEAAFDTPYAQSLGMPEDVQYWPKKKGPFNTVEQFYTDLEARTGYLIEHKLPGLYTLDSLDALSDEKEMEREIDQNSFGAGKAKKLSEMFRKITRQIEESQLGLIIISQIRDKIGITFGRKTSRSGGHALDFYASQVIYLAHLKTLYRTIKGQKRAVGVRVKAKCDKNKIGPPFRECEFTIRFGFGVDDLQANLDWLKESGKLKAFGLEHLSNTDDLNDDDHAKMLFKSQTAVKQAWSEIEQAFRPKRSKYNAVSAVAEAPAKPERKSNEKRENI